MTIKSSSCIGCRHFVATADVPTLGTGIRNLGTPICKVRAMPLLLAEDASTTKGTVKLEIIAKDCPVNNNDNVPDHPAIIRQSEGLYIGPPKDSGQHGTMPVLLSSCASCSQYIKPEEVTDRTGWTGVGACAARGMLVPMNRRSTVAQSCQSIEKQAALDPITQKITRASLDNFKFEAMYGLRGGAIHAGQVVADVQVATVFVEPKDYPTDMPVSPEDQKTGIRAWRKIVNPGRKSQAVLLAIYEGSYFTDEERAKIPQTGDDEAPELYNDYSQLIYKIAVAWNELNETPAIWGDPGTGKTELFRHIAWMMQLPFERISITATTEVDDLMGKMMFVGGETSFQYGRLPLAWMKPCVVVIDEPNVGPDEVWHVLRPLTDNSKQLILDQSDGGRVDKHVDCYLGMAMNPAWDVRNAGANTLADADSSRLMHMAIALPEPKIEMQIISERVQKDGWDLEEDTLKQLMTVATDIRRLSLEGSIPISWGIRHQIKVARALKWFTPVDAYKAAAADFLEPTFREALMDIVRATMKVRP